MKTKTIKQTVTFAASPKEVYDLLMDKKKYAAFVGGDVKVSKKIKGKFEVFDGYCTGYNIELEDGKKIIQAWHFAENGWPDDYYTTCTFLFEKKDKGTKLTFTQAEVPEISVESLKSGWKEYYWTPMKKYLKK